MGPDNGSSQPSNCRLRRRFMSTTFHRFICAILLTSYGSISACGSGLHVLVDPSHVESRTNCSSEDDYDSTPSSPDSDHSDCLICHVASQKQLPLRSEPISSESVAIGRINPSVPTNPSSTNSLHAPTRAPPITLPWPISPDADCAHTIARSTNVANEHITVVSWTRTGHRSGAGFSLDGPCRR